jgi:competence protein ComEA
MKMKPWHLILLGLICGLLAAGIILLVNSPARGKPVQLPPAPTQAPIAVDVSGAVHNPGVYYLEFGSRVEDAVSAAGGFLPEAFTESINMAAPLSDGSKVLVPLQHDPAGATDSGQIIQSGEPAQTNFPININTASKEILMQLPGIGEIKAQAIIDFRNQHGPFTELEQIQDVSGIGTVTFENLKDLITIY